MIPTQIRQVHSTIRQYDVPVLLMGGQACVLYGAAESSRVLDLAVLSTEASLPRLALAMGALAATVIDVPRLDDRRTTVVLDADGTQEAITLEALRHQARHDP